MLHELTPIWKDFERKVNTYADEGSEILNLFKNCNTEPELEELATEYSQWINKVNQYLRDSLVITNNEFCTTFLIKRNNRFRIPGGSKNIDTLLKVKLEDFSTSVRNLRFYLKLILICDQLVRPEDIAQEERINYNTRQTLDFLMNKLYDLYDDNCYPIITILKGNGVELRVKHEEREFAKALEERGLVELTSYGDIYARLTIDGKLYVEEMRNRHPIDYNKIDQDRITIKIDEVMARLRELHFGQQVLFDELEGLKTYNKTLDIRSWGQLLQMKLFDLVANKVVDSATASAIFKEITNQTLNLN